MVGRGGTRSNHFRPGGPLIRGAGPGRLASMNGGAELPRFLERRYRLLLLGILVLGALFRVGVHVDLSTNDPIFSSPPLDSRVFIDWAGRIAAGDVFGTAPPADRAFFLNPLYPYFLAPLVGLAGSAHLLAVRIVQMILGLAAVLLTAAAGRRLFGAPAGLLAALLAAVYPVLLFYEQTVMIVTLAVFLNAFLLLLLVRWRDRPSFARAFSAGLVLGLAILARPNVALFALLLPLWFLSGGPRPGRVRFALRHTVFTALGAVLVVLPVTARNLLVGKDLVPVTSSFGVNLYVSNNPAAWSTGRMTSSELRPNPVLIEKDADRIAERAEGRALRPSEVSRYWTRRALRAMGRHPATALAWIGRKLLFFLRGFELPSSYHYEAQKEDTVFLRRIPLPWDVLCPLALLGAVFVHRRRHPGTVLVLLFLSYAVGLAIFYPLGHYRAPALPAMFRLGAFAVVEVAGLAAARRWAGLGAAALLLLLFLGLGQATVIARELGWKSLSGHPDDRSIFYYNRGMILLGRGDLIGAERAFREAGRRDPTSWLPHMGRAAVARERGEPANEKRHLLAALALRPDDARARAGLGRVLAETGQAEEGFRIAKEALEDSPQDATVHFILAEMHLARGEYAEALRYFESGEAAGWPGRAIIADQSRCLRHLGRYEEAWRRVNRALAAAPWNGPLRLEHAHLLAHRGAPAAEIARDLKLARKAGLAAPPELSRYLPGGE